MEFPNNVNVLRDIKLPLENIVGYLNEVISKQLSGGGVLVLLHVK